MQISSDLSLRQTRKLAMTPQLRQFIGLLRLNNAELGSFLLREIRRNPFLQLRMDVEGARHAADASDPGGRLHSAPPAPGAAGPGAQDQPRGDLADAPSGLLEHVTRQIRLEICDPGEQRIAFAFLEALEPYGWLGRSVEEIAAECACSAEDAEEVLARLQQFEPAGLFARSLAECLRIQAREQGILDECLGTVLDRLDLVASGNLQALAGLCGSSVAHVTECVGTLRRLDPKPGLAFSGDTRPLRPPDLILSRGAEGWIVELNASTLPVIVVRDDGVRDKDRRETFVAEALASARGLKRAIELRNASTLAVASAMVRRQSAFLASEAAGLLPLSLKDVAEMVGMHQSTVSRVTSGLTMETPRGLIELRSLLCRGLRGAGAEEAVAVTDVRARIRSMIGSEPPDAPLSDEGITARLKAEGIGIERRTVAKYRYEMGIPSSSHRRRTGRMQPKR